MQAVATCDSRMVMSSCCCRSHSRRSRTWASTTLSAISSCRHRVSWRSANFLEYSDTSSVKERMQWAMSRMEARI
ncbi:hypothetical protein EYF80_050416 [Liparis tanakae]|uniref:Uncharacterized protein n=1 Tax=Liparis tanakae TaxID=230148 RepID=A0A4Z2FDV0_9TELE|nr:hypothetical protein EYF80_050416 [Liparis tanakae]